MSALAACLLLLVSACGGSDVESPPSVNTLPTTSPSASAAPTVTVTGLSDGVRVQIDSGTPGISPGGGLAFVSPVYTLGPSGSLGATATVTIELDHAVPAGTTLVTATRESSSDPWTWLPATLTKDLGHAQFTTDHFSQFGVLAYDAAGALSSYQEAVTSGLVSSADATAEKPVCADVAAARKDGYKATSSPHKTFAWCFGLAKGKRVLTVVNRHDVPVQVAHGVALATSTTSKVSGAWTTWLGLLGRDGDTTFLAPGGSVTYDAELVPGGSLVASTESSAVALSVRALYVAVNALVTQLDTYGTKVPTTAQAFAVLVAKQGCADALGKGSDALLEGCLSVPRLRRVLGDSTTLLRPVIAAPSMKRFWAGRFAFLAQQQTSTDAQSITVKRVASDFGKLAGTYTGHTRVLTITKSGLVTERLDSGTEPVIELTYQLSDLKVAAGKNGSTTASSLLTQVKIYDRDAISGAPPKVGSTGILTLRSGIITPPYLQTTYCNKAAAAKAQCGA